MGYKDIKGCGWANKYVCYCSIEVITADCGSANPGSIPGSGIFFPFHDYRNLKPTYKLIRHLLDINQFSVSDLFTIVHHQFDFVIKNNISIIIFSEGIRAVKNYNIRQNNPCYQFIKLYSDHFL